MDAAVRTLRQPPYEHMPALFDAGFRWLGSEPAPARVLCFADQDGHPVFAALWPADPATEIGLLPLGGGDDRLQMPIIGAWKQLDRSLTSIGQLPAGQLTLAPPPLPPDYYEHLLSRAGYPANPANLSALREHITQQFTAKAYQFISSQNQALATRFVDDHRGSLPQQVLEDLGAWNHEVLPYIQDLPGRVRGLLLQVLAEAPDSGFWKTLEH